MDHAGLNRKKEAKLQQAATCVEYYVRECSLAYSREKSELIRIWYGKSDKPNTQDPSHRLRIILAGQEIAEKALVRILGMWVQSNHQNNDTLTTLRTITLKVARMIVRITTRRHGMREEDTLKLVRSFVVSRVTYSIPYQHVTRGEQDQVDALLRRAYKAALKLPLGTPNNKLLSIGLHNTFEELREAQLATQLSQLAHTTTGRDLLRRLGHVGSLRDIVEQQCIPPNVQANHKVAPIPRNMDPQLHHGLREARVEALRKDYSNGINPTYCYGMSRARRRGGRR